MVGRRRKNGQSTGSRGKTANANENNNHASYEQSRPSGTVIVEEHGTEVLLVRSEPATDQFPESIKQSRYSRSFIQHQKRLEESQSNVTLDHLLQSSLDLDSVAKKKIDEVRAIGSKRFASELIELLESASRCVEQNANLLHILRHHLGLGNNESKEEAEAAASSSTSSTAASNTGSKDGSTNL